ncbi:DNA-binding protein [Paenibacillus polymyxa]|nr:DNA-binding protein [Paenibacillus polymyxa]
MVDDPSKKELRPVLTIKDAASYLQRSTKTIRNRIKAGEIRSYKEGQEHRIRREWLLEYEQSLIESTN